jgi:hypothetical protein
MRHRAIGQRGRRGRNAPGQPHDRRFGRGGIARQAADGTCHVLVGAGDHDRQAVQQRHLES